MTPTTFISALCEPGAMKHCPRCKTTKPERDFGIKSQVTKELKCWCRECTNADRTERRSKNVEIHRERERLQYEQNKEARQASALKYYYRNKEYCDAKSKEWKRNNPEKRKAGQRRRNFKKYHTDVSNRLGVLLRSRVRYALGGRPKNQKIVELIGCPIVWFEAHIESLFKPGMSWENHGPVWHIDHIKPCAAFDLSCEDQQRACFHWTNQQPLFALDNLRKGSKYNG